jgi:hypothetical protein
MKGPGDVKLREASTIRFIQALAGGIQVFMGFAGVGDVLPKTIVIFIMAGVGATQAAVAIWNSGLHNEPAKTYEPPKL